MQTYYYNRPTPQDVLIEERDWNQTNMSYSGFTGQLRGWWDNYLTIDERAMVINDKATKDGIDNLGMALVANRKDAVYTLILTILEHFNDTFMSRVMELPENKLEHWKAKFIDGLPSLFAERVRKVLRGSYGEIPYTDYTYGKLIGICTHEGLNMCNELRLSRQLKMDKLKERNQLGDFCTQFGLPETSTHKKKKHKYHRYPNQDSPYRRKRSRYRSKEEREAKKAHRKTTIFTKNRSKRDLADIKCYKCEFEYSPPYSLLEVNNRLLNKNATPARDSSFDDLKIKVENLKREIKSLKQNQMICDHRITQIEKIKSPDEKSNDKNKGMMQIITAHKWYIKCTILIDNDFSITNIAMIDSGADVSCIQEGWNPPGVGEEVEVGEDRPHNPEEGHHLHDRHTDPHQTPQLYKWEEEV
ncbi:uncharacterized protein [Nicotiana tomentosiformis]|uniref:uncharacterized protein n=1 Tax=Nicotiana tomentosiformis TaxID=4098 RepID=UPI00388C7787